MKIKCVIFDADGVVISSELFSLQYQKQFNISNDEMLPFFNGAFNDCLTGKIDLKKAVQPYLKKWKWTGTVDEFLQFWFKSEHHTNEKIVNLIKDLRNKNIRCYLATNQEARRTEYMKKEMGFEDIFNHIFSSADIGHKKPEKEFYEFIFNWINKTENITKKEIFYTDDSKKAIDTANTLGIKTHLYTNFEDFSKLLK